MKLIKSLTTKASELVNKGLSINSYPPAYYYSKLDELKVPMISEATTNAKERAQSIVKNTGKRISNLQSAGLGVFQITPADSTDVSDSGISDTSSINKKMTAVVNATYIFK